VRSDIQIIIVLVLICSGVMTAGLASALERLDRAAIQARVYAGEIIPPPGRISGFFNFLLAVIVTIVLGSVVLFVLLRR
jgi:hypothetical protein